LDKNAERLGRLKPEEKIAIDMTDTCIRICADGIRAQNPGISEEELIEKLKERLEWKKRNQTPEERALNDEEDVKAILRFTNWTRKQQRSKRRRTEHWKSGKVSQVARRVS
jgi:cytochrome c